MGIPAHPDPVPPPNMGRYANNDPRPVTKTQLSLMVEMCEQLGMSRTDRLEFAEFFLNVDIESYQTLTYTQASRILDGLRGAVLIAEQALSK